METEQQQMQQQQQQPQQQQQQQSQESDTERIRTFLWELIIRGEIEILKKFFEKIKIDMKMPINPLGMTCLHLATTCLNVDLVRYFVEMLNAPIDYRDNNGRTALHYATAHNAVQIAEYLISKGANINALTNGLDTPMMKAAQFKQTDVIQALLKYPDLDLFAKNYSGYTFFDLIQAYNNEEYYQQIYEQYFLIKMLGNNNQIQSQQQQQQPIQQQQQIQFQQNQFQQQPQQQQFQQQSYQMEFEKN